MAPNNQQTTWPAANDHANGNHKDDDTLPAQPAHLNIRFTEPSGFELTFRLKSNTKLGRAMDGFSARTERSRPTRRFLLDGVRVQPDDTPEILEMEDGDTIEVHLEQLGGSALVVGEDDADEEYGLAIYARPEQVEFGVVCVYIDDHFDGHLFFRLTWTARLGKVSDLFCHMGESERDNKFLVVQR